MKIKRLAKQAHSFPIVGIGASAGGLEAFTTLFAHLPKNLGMAYVAILHLDPTHKSIMHELFAKSTSMPVHEAEHGVRVRQNHVYVIPPNKNISIVRGILKLSPRTSLGGHHLPIDHFMRSLAHDQKSGAIGIVLSGTASDGAWGLQEIKAEGGITMAQDENSAQYSGMPHAAVAAGDVDFILPPKEIAEELGRIGAHLYAQSPSAGAAALSLPEKDANLNEIFLLLRVIVGVDFTLYKRSTILRRLSRRMAIARKNNLSDYLAYLKEHRGEVLSLYQDMLITVTKFFRDPQLFDDLTRKVFPALVKGRPHGEPLRVWVAGCSGGEEAYSLAICLREFLEENSLSYPVQLFGTDLSEKEIAKARAGVFPETIAQDVSPARLKRFFVKEDSHYRIQKNIRDICVFAKHNLIADPPFSSMDIVSCRNVLIYMEQALQKKIFPIFHFALKPRDFLLLGPSETIGGFTKLFTVLEDTRKIFMKKSNPREIHAARAAGSFEALLPAAVPRLLAGQQASSDAVVDVQKEADRLLLAQFTPPGVLIDENMEIVQFRGQTGAFLEAAPGKASFNLLKMAKEGLMIDLRATIQKAAKLGVPVSREGIEVGHAHDMVSVSIEVVPAKSPASSGNYFLVLFKTAIPRGGMPVTAPEKFQGTKVAHAKKISDRQIIQLRAELSATKEYLQSVIETHEATNEELKASNEEILSTNEELQSTNEELETAKEELQSTNEELTTVNDEMKNRNFELEETVDFIEAIIKTIREPLVILNAYFQVKNANHSFYKFFHTSKEETEGKQFYELGGGQWDIPELHTFLEKFLQQDNKVQDFQVELAHPSLGQRSLHLNACRLRQKYRKEALILLAIEDVTDRKKLEQHKDDFIALASHELKTPLTCLKMFAQAIQPRFKKIGDRELMKLFSTMDGQIDKLAGIVNGLLDVARTQGEKIVYKKEVFAIDGLIQDTLASIQRITGTHTIIFKRRAHGRVLADRDRIEQVLINLVNNAIKYSPRAHKIIIAAEKDSKQVTVSVRDFGIGIAKRDQGKIFSRFFQVSDSHAATFPGLGLGLYICSEIITRHNGRIWVESDEKKGSTFVFTLPLAPVKEKAGKAP